MLPSLLPAVPNPRAHFEKLLRQAALRVTPARLEILTLLDSSRVALDANEVFDRLTPTTSDRVTVYRTLASFVKAGLVHRIDPGDRRYRFSITDHSDCTHDHHVHEHPHLICDRCGSVECLQDTEIIIRTHPTQVATAGPSPLRWINEQQVTLRGLCGRCNSTPAIPTPLKTRPRPPKPSPSVLVSKRASPRQRSRTKS